MWQVTAAANGLIMVAYSLIAAAILLALVRTNQVRTNLLGSATAMIFFTCAVHHGSHTFHMLGPYVGWEVHEGLAMREAMGWHAAVWDVLSAGVAVYYWSLRRSYGALLHRGPVLFADLKERQRSALEINDNIVQGLTLAQYRYEAGQHEAAHEAVVKTLAAARKMMSDLVDPSIGMPIEPGDLVRTVAAQPTGAPDDRAVVGR
jgi:signal transduction histidine kinase